MPNQEFKALKPKGEFSFEKPNPKLLEKFPNPGVLVVTLTNKEFTSLCPITHQPDYATITIRYWPGQWCLESKSLKLYCASYRNYGAFAEELACLIRKDLEKLLECPVDVTVQLASRGGVIIEAVA